MNDVNTHSNSLIEVNNVYKSFKSEQKNFFSRQRTPILKGVSLQINQGDCLGIIGESGSGKSTLGRVLLGLEKPDQGSVTFDNQTLYGSSSALKNIRKQISAVFQDYNASVNGYLTVQDIVAEPILIHEKLSRSQRQEKVAHLLQLVGLNTDLIQRYPHELSGGQLQRVCIARAIACQPKFILLDEAVSSLDVSIQVQVLDLLAQLQNQFNLTYLFITHDLTTVTYLCNRVAFFYQGQIIEEVNPIDQLGQVTHPYSRTLLNAVLDF